MAADWEHAAHLQERRLVFPIIHMSDMSFDQSDARSSIEIDARHAGSDANAVSAEPRRQPLQPPMDTSLPSYLP